MIVRFPVPEEPVSANSKIANPRSRGGSIRLSRYRQAWRDTCEVYALAHPEVASLRRSGRHFPPSTVQVSIPFYEQRRRDPHNYTSTVVKWIVDGLVRAGVWPDDNPEFVTVLDPLLVIGNEVKVTIQPRNVRTTK